MHPNAYLPEFLVKLPTPFEVHCTTYKLSNEQTSASKMEELLMTWAKKKGELKKNKKGKE